jgi:hypothetical protein
VSRYTALDKVNLRYQMIENKIREKFHIHRKDYSPFLCEGGRNEMATLFAELGYTTGAEIGVYTGEFSTVLCKSIPGLKLYCIDPWLPFDQHRSGRRMEHHYQTCVRNLAPYNVEFMRTTSLEASKVIPNNALDFVYIDALHEFKDVMMDILLWEPKVKPGGIVSGHDYFHALRYGVIEAVNAFVAAHNLRMLCITSPDTTNGAPSWFWLKV